MAEKKIKSEEIIETSADGTTMSQEDYLNEYVPIFLFKDSKDYKDDVFVSLNGETCKIKRGVETKIKRKFKLLIDEAVRQNMAAEEAEEALAREVLMF